MKYTVFIDESGDQGLDKIRNKDRGGATEFMSLGAVIIPNHRLDEYRIKIDEIRSKLKLKTLHCKEMNHKQKAFFARSINELQVLLFTVISKKETLGNYKGKIAGSEQAQFYYNKCTQFLLERICHFMKLEDIGRDQVSFVFERIQKYDYQVLRNYISVVQKNPIADSAKLLKHIDPFSIRAEEKHEEKLLEIADLVAHSSYQLVNYSKDNFFMPEHRYFKEVKSSFWSSKETNEIANFGVKLIRGPYKNGLKREEQNLFKSLYKPKE